MANPNYTEIKAAYKILHEALAREIEKGNFVVCDPVCFELHTPQTSLVYPPKENKNEPPSDS